MERALAPADSWPAASDFTNPGAVAASNSPPEISSTPGVFHSMYHCDPLNTLPTRCPRVDSAQFNPCSRAEQSAIGRLRVDMLDHTTILVISYVHEGSRCH